MFINPILFWGVLVGIMCLGFVLGVAGQISISRRKLEDVSGDPSRTFGSGSARYYIVPSSAEVKEFDSAIRYKIPLKRTRKKKAESAVEVMVGMVGDEVTEDLSEDPRMDPPVIEQKAPVYPSDD